MNIKIVEKEAFYLIGKEADSNQTGYWIKELWQEVDKNFSEILKFAKKDKDGSIAGIWGAMSDFSRAFLPWTNNYSEGLYMVGVEVNADSVAPRGWTKWKIPGFKYLTVKVNDNYQDVFTNVITEYMPENKVRLIGAVQEYYCPKENMQLYLYFPYEKL